MFGIIRIEPFATAKNHVISFFFNLPLGSGVGSNFFIAVFSKTWVPVPCSFITSQVARTCFEMFIVAHEGHNSIVDQFFS